MENQPQKKVLSSNQKKSAAGASLAGTIIYLFSSGILTSDAVVAHLQGIAHSQVAQAGFFYMAGQWLNNVMVRRSMIRLQSDVLEKFDVFTTSITKSIDDLALALRADISAKADRKEMQDGFNRVHERIDDLQSRTQP